MKIIRNKYIWAYSIVGIAILVLSFIRTQKNNAQVLPILSELIDFRLIDQNGNQFIKDDLLGKFWIADFIFTTCAGPCPIMSNQFTELQSRYSNANDINLLSISVNPEYDTPVILREYGERYSSDNEKWHFLTGEKEEIHKLAVEGFKIGSIEDPIFHSTRFILIDNHARIRGYYISTEFEEMQKLWADVDILAQEVL
tara:strand:+ start:1635 stop:2228 length:594 start_codon:yes stop_codon:yes gene_type:complete